MNVPTHREKQTHTHEGDRDVARSLNRYSTVISKMREISHTHTVWWERERKRGRERATEQVARVGDPLVLEAPAPTHPHQPQTINGINNNNNKLACV